MNKKTEIKKSLQLTTCSFSLKQGFSLVELLIVIAIMTIMTGVLLATKNSNKADKDVEAVARQIASQIRSLQNEALNGKMISGDIACKYELTIAATSYGLKYYKNCSTAEAKIDAGDQNFDLSKQGVSLNPSSLFFLSPQGAVDSSKTIIVSSKLDSNVKNWVCVSANGSVVEQKTVCL